MNKQSAIAIVAVVIILVIGGIWYVGSKNSSSSQMNMTEPSMTMQAPAGTQNNSATSSPKMSQNAVTIQNFAFSPNSLTVKVGDKVTWTNQDSVGHSATADDGSFDTGILSKGQSGNVTFSKPGTYTYHCSVHPNMKGTIIVQ